MKKEWTTGGIALAAILVLAGAPQAQAETKKKAAGSAAATYKIDPALSSAKWVGKKVTGQHNGTVAVKSGQLKVANGTVTDGTVVLNMTSIKVDDLTDADSNGKLTGHLKSDDFFSVEKHPTATFDITGVEPIAGAKAGEPNARVTGTLEVKGKSKPLTFPVTITTAGDKIQASAKNITVDRTVYDIRYGSGKFFQGLGDKMIYDEFTIDFDVTAKK